MCNNSKIPPPPSLSPQELDLIEQQRLSLDQFQDLLTEESTQRSETRDILKNVSGLFKTIDVPAGPDKITFVPDKGAIGRIKEAIGGAPGNTSQERIQSLLSSGGIDQPTANLITELASRNRNFEQGIKDSFVVLDQIADGTSTLEDHNIDPAKLAQLGAEKTIAGDPATTRQELDQDAIADLRQRIQDAQDFEQAQIETGRDIESRGLDILGKIAEDIEGSFEDTDLSLKQKEIASEQADRQLQALRGELPVDPALTERKKQDFGVIAENLRRRGFEVIGDDPDTAVAVGTPAVQQLEEFRKRFGLVEDASRRGELDSGAIRNISQTGLVTDMFNNQINRGLTFRGGTAGVGSGAGVSNTLNLLTGAQNAGPASLLGAYPALTGGFSQAQSPFAQQRQLGFNQQVGNAQLASQNQAGLLNFGSSLASSFLLRNILSTKKAKKNIRKLTTKSEDNVLKMVKKGDVYTFDYKFEEDGKEKPNHIGLLVEESPSEIVSKDRVTLDVGNYLGTHHAAIRSLTRKVETLERKLTRRVA